MMILSDLILNNPDITIMQAWNKARDMDDVAKEKLGDFWLAFGPEKKLKDVLSRMEKN
jgi:hypothetical protein